MKFTQTKTFGKLLAPMDAEIAELTAQISQIAGTIESKNAANAVAKRKSDRLPTKGDENKLERLQKQLNALVERRLQLHTELPRSFYGWLDLINMLVEVSGNVWTARQQELGAKELEAYEGRYEDSYRDARGWPLGASLDCTDFPGNGEGKYLREDTTFRISKIGTTAFGKLLRTVSREFPDETMTAEQWETLFGGEVSQSKVYNTLPEPVRTRIQTVLEPTKVLNYEYMVFLVDHGYIEVPKADYAKAISLVAITQMSPRYRLKREYVEERLLATLNEVEVIKPQPIIMVA